MLENSKKTANKPKILFVVTEAFQKELHERLAQDGYGRKEKSRWVSEAIEQLLSFKNYPEYVNGNQQMNGLKKSESIIVDFEIMRKIDEAILKVRTEFPILEGPQSCIVRADIVQRFLRGYKGKDI